MKTKFTKFIFILLSSIAIILTSCGNSSETSKSSEEKKAPAIQVIEKEQTYDDKKSSIEDEEKNDPLRFLSISGTARDQLLGSKTVLEFSIFNDATIATYKDVVLQIKFFSKTKSEIGSENITEYTYFPPKQSKSFKEKIKAPNKTVSVGIEIIKASSN